MAQTLSERLTDQFYRWEERGRGWFAYGEPVGIEPPFVPFYFTQPQHKVIDDGRVPFLFERIGNFFVWF